MGGTPTPKGKAKAKATPKNGVPKKRPAAAISGADSVEEVAESTPKPKATPKKTTIKRPAASQSAGAASGSAMKRPSSRNAEQAVNAADGERGDTEAPGFESSAPVALEGAALESSALVAAESEADAAPHGDAPSARRSALRRPAAASQGVTGARIFEIF